MKADLAKVRALLAKADFLAAVPGLGKCVTVEREDLRELIAIAEAVERAPVFPADFFTEAGRVVGVDINKYGAERVRLLAIGEDGNG